MEGVDEEAQGAKEGEMNNTDPFEIERQCELARFEKAKKIRWDEYDGPVYCDDTGEDGYHENLSAFWDWCDDFERSVAPPPYVWACKSTQFAQIDLEDIWEMIYDKSYEGFDETALEGRKELKVAIDKFNESNKHIVAWDVDYLTAILLENGGEE